jgi:glycosyltransferase involved in cell wall biosynthesis
MSSISVVMTTYNGSRFLVAQIESIMAQTRHPDEVVIVDDCSTDNSYEILQTYQAKYPGLIRVYQNLSRLGINKNFEKAAQLSTGALIFFSDQDDVWAPKKIQTMVDHFDGFSLLYSNAVIIDEHGHVISDSELKFNAVPVIAGNPLIYLLQSNSISGHNILITRKLLHTAIPFSPNIVYDQWLGIVACLNKGIGYIDDALVMHRMHNSNAMNNPSLQKGVHNNHVDKISKLQAFRRDSGKKLSAIKRIFEIGSPDEVSMEIVNLYSEHLTHAKTSFFNLRLYKLALAYMVSLHGNVTRKKLKKMAHKMSRGELYFRVFRF